MKSALTQVELSLSPQAIIIAVIPKVKSTIEVEAALLVFALLEVEQFFTLGFAHWFQFAFEVAQKVENGLGSLGHADFEHPLGVVLVAEQLCCLLTKLDDLGQ